MPGPSKEVTHGHHASDGAGAARARSVADTLAPLLELVFSGPPPVRFDAWDGSGIGPADAPATLRLRSPDALRRMLWSPDELGLGRAYVAGDLDLDGDIVDGLGALEIAPPHGVRRAPHPRARRWRVAACARPRRPPPPPPPEEAHAPRPAPLDSQRDAQAISHHYDVGNDFYRIVLGPSMTYSCARFGRRTTTDLAAAQAAQARPRLPQARPRDRAGMRLLDVGCGWGSMAHPRGRATTARTVVGITISERAGRGGAASGSRRPASPTGSRSGSRTTATLGGEPFDAISSIGMFEHVGAPRMAQYFATLRRCSRPGGRLLNHAISSASAGSRLGRRVVRRPLRLPRRRAASTSASVVAADGAGRLRGPRRRVAARALRPHAAARGSRNLEARLGRAPSRAVGEGRARVWRLYMAGSAIGFDAGASRSTRRSVSSRRRRRRARCPAARLVTRAAELPTRQPHWRPRTRPRRAGDASPERGCVSRVARAGTRGRRARSRRPSPRRACRARCAAP